MTQCGIPIGKFLIRDESVAFKTLSTVAFKSQRDNFYNEIYYLFMQFPAIGGSVLSHVGFMIGLFSSFISALEKVDCPFSRFIHFGASCTWLCFCVRFIFFFAVLRDGVGLSY